MELSQEVCIAVLTHFEPTWKCGPPRHRHVRVISRVLVNVKASRAAENPEAAVSKKASERANEDWELKMKFQS